MDNNELKIIIPVVLGTIVICLIMCAAVALAKTRRRTAYRTEQIDTVTENIEQGSSNTSWLRSPLSSPRSQRYIQIPAPATTRAESTAVVSDPPPAYQQSQHDVRVQISPA
ncbi:predicted protein [Lichtheimia corymbifera JMRC:FSU:9682]|uniref:Uncharacterized protein n=1 Tax=Lichtheimia corymbifera JMRC:FSU:9682 TaxID=1263082 RepID=A0A068S1W4_9FUNG|nr:predicted protein [Lichtheimia corymbifera JMRC:FSU:9682]